MTSPELRRDHAILAAAMAMEAAHLLDDGLLNPHDGVAEVSSALIAVAIAVAAVAVYGRLATWAKAVLAGVFGLAGLAAGLEMHVIPALQHGAEGSDYTGFGHAAAGLVLLALATSLATRRPSPQPS
jgi:Flp pilus assembly pilin Flp